MNSDIRLQMSFYSNTKVKRLYRELGADGPLSLLFLWLYVAENRPHGELRGMDIEDVAIAAQWPGEAERFVECITRLKFLDRKGKLLVVHDWESNNPWAFGAPERKIKAANAAKAKWSKNNKKSACYEQDLACSPDARSNAPSPSPSPSPIPKEPTAAHTRTELVFLDCFAEKENRLKELFPQHNYEVVKETCIAHYRTKPPPLDPWADIMKWFGREQVSKPSFGKPQGREEKAEQGAGGFDPVTPQESKRLMEALRRARGDSPAEY